jgi:ribosomal protein S12 methylthiotransferase accessory factor
VAQLGRPHLAPNVRIVATRDGVIVLSSNGCFRVSGRCGRLFVSDVLPHLYGKESFNIKSPSNSPDWWSDFYQQLSEVDIIRFSSNARTPIHHHDEEAGVAVIRHTSLTGRLAEHLAILGIKMVNSVSRNVFAIADFSGLDTDHSLQLARQLHESGCRSISFWKRGSETFYGPLAEPFRTACWNCCRLRFSDSVSGKNEAPAENDLTSPKVVTDNVLLAVRYPGVAAYGCVVAEGGGVSSVHSVLPVPWCEVCNFAGAPADSCFVPPLHSVHVPEELRILADTRGGVVRGILLYDSDGSEAPTIPLCCTALIAPHSHENEQQTTFRGEGKGATRDDAARSAIGEGIERYAASIWHPSTLTYASFNELERRAFDPHWLVLYDDEQYERADFPFARFDIKRPMYWKAGKWLDTNEEVQVPAVATYMNFPTADAERFGQTTSNGLAAGATFEDAALRALYELIERDAFMLFWLAQRPALRVAIDCSDVLTHQALREVERLGARTELYLIDVGTKHPTMVCIGFGDGCSWPGVTIGLGTHASVDIALRRAVFEHGHYGAYMRRLMRNGEHKKIRNGEDVLTNLDHGLYYLDPNHSTALDFFRASAGDPVSLMGLRCEYRQDATLSACVSCLADAGIRTAAVDVTPPDIKLAPMRVVRGFGIYMQPIHFGTANRRLKNPRLDGLLSSAAETSPHPMA